MWKPPDAKAKDERKRNRRGCILIPQLLWLLWQSQLSLFLKQIDWLHKSTFKSGVNSPCEQLVEFTQFCITCFLTSATCFMFCVFLICGKSFPSKWGRTDMPVWLAAYYWPKYWEMVIICPSMPDIKQNPPHTWYKQTNCHKCYFPQSKNLAYHMGTCKFNYHASKSAAYFLFIYHTNK